MWQPSFEQRIIGENEMSQRPVCCIFFGPQSRSKSSIHTLDVCVCVCACVKREQEPLNLTPFPNLLWPISFLFVAAAVSKLHFQSVSTVLLRLYFFEV
jgi:hypothetical protein